VERQGLPHHGKRLVIDGQGCSVVMAGAGFGFSLALRFLGQAGNGAGQQKQKSQKYPHRCTSFFGRSCAAESGMGKILCQIEEREYLDFLRVKFGGSKETI